MSRLSRVKCVIIKMSKLYQKKALVEIQEPFSIVQIALNSQTIHTIDKPRYFLGGRPLCGARKARCFRLKKEKKVGTSFRFLTERGVVFFGTVSDAKGVGRMFEDINKTSQKP